jgi:hypothetical protein
MFGLAPDRFDDLTRTLGATTSRRQAFRLLVGGLAASLLPSLRDGITTPAAAATRCRGGDEYDRCYRFAEEGYEHQKREVCLNPDVNLTGTPQQCLDAAKIERDNLFRLCDLNHGQCPPCHSCQDKKCVSTCDACQRCDSSQDASGRCVPRCRPCHTCDRGRCTSTCNACQRCDPSQGVSGECVPRCPPCHTCDRRGRCTSRCNACQRCDSSQGEHGECVARQCPPCHTCENGRCKSRCRRGEECQNGECVARRRCPPCHTWENGTCRSRCNLCQVCEDGECVLRDPRKTQECRATSGRGGCCTPEYQCCSGGRDPFCCPPRSICCPPGVCCRVGSTCDNGTCRG